MTNTQKHDESSGWEDFAIACFIVIAISTLIGLIALPKKEGEKLTLSFWALTIPFVVSFSAVGCWLSEPREGCSDQDEKPDSLTGSSEDGRGSRADDPQMHTHVVLDTSFDERLAKVAIEVDRLTRRLRVIDEFIVGQARVNTASLTEKERQARDNLIAMLSDLGLAGGVLAPLFRATRICMDDRLWQVPAQYETRYQDAERFYCEEKIWPIIRDNRIEWGTRPDFERVREPDLDSPFIDEDMDQSVKQTPFNAFDCCSDCHYLGEDEDSCAVVPFGCGTGDSSELCRDYQSVNPKDGPELGINPGESLRQARLEESILDPLTKIIAAFAKSTEGVDVYEDNRYLFCKAITRLMFSGVTMLAFPFTFIAPVIRTAIRISGVLDTITFLTAPLLRIGRTSLD